MFRQLADFLCTLCSHTWAGPFDPTKGYTTRACPKCHMTVGVKVVFDTVRTEKAPRV